MQTQSNRKTTSHCPHLRTAVELLSWRHTQNLTLWSLAYVNSKILQLFQMHESRKYWNSVWHDWVHCGTFAQPFVSQKSTLPVSRVPSMVHPRSNCGLNYCKHFKSNFSSSPLSTGVFGTPNLPSKPIIWSLCQRWTWKVAWTIKINL